MLNEIIYQQASLAKVQREDPNHTRLSREVILKWGLRIKNGTVLDVGCGSGFARRFWESLGYEWIGIVYGEDYNIAKKNGGTVVHADMHLLDAGFEVDVIYARHILEHSLVPAVALSSWRDQCDYCMVVVPSFENCAYQEDGHVSIFPKRTWERYFKFAGFSVEKFEKVDYNNPKPWPQEGSEYRWFLV